MKTNCLFVGEHPSGFSGNSHMMAELLRRVDYSKYNVSVFAGTRGVIEDPFQEPKPYSIIEGGDGETDNFGDVPLKVILDGLTNLHIVVIVGLDIWRYSKIFPEILAAKKKNKFKWAAIFPYDLSFLRLDWVDWINQVDFPCVYSEFGFNMLKEYVPNIRYFRPPLWESEKFLCFPDEVRKEKKAEVFKMLRDDAFVFGFFGINQFRKDPQRLIKAFFEVKKELPHVHLYLHTELSGVYDLKQFSEDCGRMDGDSFIKSQGRFYDTAGMMSTYNVIDCLVSTSLQEGLNWTIVEAMLCGVPVLASHNTAHIELLKDGAGIPVECTDLAFQPIVTKSGISWAETRACNFGDLVSKMKMIATDPDLWQSLKVKGMARAEEWLKGESNINALLSDMGKITISVRKKEKAILFMQHSSAGDVLMSTQCFKGLKEKHNLPLVYMTQDKYKDIVVGNPYVNEIIGWDESKRDMYQVAYNPHGDRILPGGFNNLDATLSSMYPYFCKVEPDKIFIDQELVHRNIEALLPPEYIVVHTTGGDAEYRTYNHMDIVIKSLNLPAVQIGGETDLRCKEAKVDLRGMLSFRQTAWVMARAKLAIVIDSFPSHLAGALGTPVVVLYGPAPARVTQPRGDLNKIINIEPNKLDVCPNLTSCWGKAGTSWCSTPCINTITPSQIVRAAKFLLEGIK